MPELCKQWSGTRATQGYNNPSSDPFSTLWQEELSNVTLTQSLLCCTSLLSSPLTPSKPPCSLLQPSLSHGPPSTRGTTKCDSPESPAVTPLLLSVLEWPHSWAPVLLGLENSHLWQCSSNVTSTMKCYKMRDICTVEYYSVTIQSELLPFVTSMDEPTGIVSEISQKTTNSVFHLYVESKKQNKCTNKTETNV